MKQSKLLLTSVAAIAAAGTTFALIEKKAISLFLKLDPDNDGICEVTSLTGYAYTNVAVGLRPQYKFGHATITANPNSAPSACVDKYYMFVE